MKLYPPSGSCQNCSCSIEKDVLMYSVEQYNFALCVNCQQWLATKKEDTTTETIDLYFSLKKRNISASLQKFDGYKTIDIAVTEAKVNIEVDPYQHKNNARQAFSDLQRTFYSFKKGFLTLRIPHSLVRENLEQTADYIKDFLAISMQRNSL
jgi:very-short-patch-repair endonuclease